MHGQLKLSIGSEDIFFEPTQKGAEKDSQLKINRVNGTISTSDSIPQAEVTANIFGIIGIIQFNTGPFLIVITKAKRVGQILGNEVFKVEEINIQKISKTTSHKEHEEDDKEYWRMIKHVLEYDGFYFSYGLDLTRNLQSIYGESSSKEHKYLYQTADERFFWNKYLQRRLIKAAETIPEIGDYILPIIMGLVSINLPKISGNGFEYMLITRRSTKRAGTRYNTRGADSNGNVANYNETEQIVITNTKHDDKVFSYVQTRGSIPLFWKQITNLKYTPKLEAERDSKSAFDKHFEEQVKLYGNQIAVNLVNQKGYELKVSGPFEENHKVSSYKDKVKLVIFDFHAKCGKSKWHQTKALIDNLEEDLNQQMYFSMEKGSKKVLSKQTSVVRTNCMDCLDRTNVVQSIFAKRALIKQLYSQSIIGSESIEGHSELDRLLKNVWSDNADIVSKFYSGTGALKTDFTRTGKRTKKGELMDGINSLVRYVKNNYTDGYRQDSIDLFLGNYEVDPSKPSPLRVPNLNAMRTYFLPILLLISLTMLIVTPLTSIQPQSSFLAVWIIVLIVSYFKIMKNPQDFLSKPRFTNPIDGRSIKPN